MFAVFYFNFKCFLGQNSEQRRAPADLDQSSMLKVICNQRDRFRARLQETEEVCHPLTLFPFMGSGLWLLIQLSFLLVPGNKKTEREDWNADS